MTPDNASTPDLLRRHFWKVSCVAGVASVGTAILLVVGAPWLVLLFYGPEYQNVLPLVRALWPYSLIGFGIGLGSLFRTVNRVSFPLRVNAITVVVGLPLSWLLVERYGALGAVYGFLAMKIGAHIAAFAGAAKALMDLRKPLS